MWSFSVPLPSFFPITNAWSDCDDVLSVSSMRTLSALDYLMGKIAAAAGPTTTPRIVDMARTFAFFPVGRWKEYGIITLQ